MNGMPCYVDCHTHLDGYGENMTDALERIERHRILTMAVGVDIPSYELACSAAERSPWVLPAFGIHPNHATAYAHRLDELDGYLCRHHVIGEIGLCSVWADDLPSQRRVFEYQLKYASQHGHGVNLHTKGQETEIAEFLRRYPVPSALVHWFSGDEESLQALLALDCYFSISVDIAQSPISREVCRRVPLHRILTETDGPGAVQWACNRPGYPEEILTVAREAAVIRNMPLDEFLEAVQRNYRSFCGQA